MSKVKKSFKEDWTLIPVILFTSIGYIVTVIDFIFFQKLKFQFFALIGLAFVIIGGYLRTKARLELKKKARFDNLISTSRLQNVEGHQLVKDGRYKHLRHPLYLGETLRNFGIVFNFFERLWNIIGYGRNNFSTLSNKCRRKNACQSIRFRL